MKGFTFATAVGLARPGPWTCHRCTQAQTISRAVKQSRGFASRAGYTGRAGQIPRPKRRGKILFAAAGGALGVSALAFGDDVRHAYEAAERSGRVASTLFVNINEYVPKYPGIGDFES